MELCPCGSGKAYQECCEAVINGTRPAQSAEELMRSRYSAYVKVKTDYILKTTHPKQRQNLDEKSVRQWAEKTDWQRLEIVESKLGGAADERGTVEFIAHFKDKGASAKHHEVAKFVKVDGAWSYEDSDIPEKKPLIRDEPKVQRNEPCPCGSGKKFKKCCGQ